MYVSQGPNFIWLIDGYDRIKPFRFPIHGATDGFSRQVLWVNICPSNNDPYIISYFYVNCISNLKYVPRTIRDDRDSENIVVFCMWWYIRGEHQDSMSGRSSFLFGSSTNNQGLESWWSILKRQNSTLWITFFKDLQDGGLFDMSLNHHKECMKF